VSRLVFVAGSDLEAAIHAFSGAGFAVGEEGGEGDRMIPLAGDATAALKAADADGPKYELVHVGPDDGAPEGSYARAHHRVTPGELPALARRLRSRERMLIRCLAFGYKHGLPPGADWVVDARFLDNPYWVEELRPLVPSGTTMAQMALRWILMNDGVSTVIPGAKNSEQARANAIAADLPPLPASSMELIARLYREQVSRLVHQRW
jgi:hypothetical protein